MRLGFLDLPRCHLSLLLNATSLAIPALTLFLVSGTVLDHQSKHSFYFLFLLPFGYDVVEFFDGVVEVNFVYFAGGPHRGLIELMDGSRSTDFFAAQVLNLFLKIIALLLKL